MTQTVDQPTPAESSAPTSAAPPGVHEAPAPVPPAPRLPDGDGLGEGVAPPAAPRRSPRLQGLARTPREDREPKAAARRTRVVVRKVGPLSVLKFSLIFYFCVFLIVFLALLIIYVILASIGAVDSLAKILGYVFGTGDAGTRDPEPIRIDGRQVFTWLFVGGLILTLVWSVINVFVAFLYNLISDIIGGVEVTLAEKPPR
jgi:hypothetical protein